MINLWLVAITGMVLSQFNLFFVSLLMIIFGTEALDVTIGGLLVGLLGTFWVVFGVIFSRNSHSSALPTHDYLAIFCLFTLSVAVADAFLAVQAGILEQRDLCIVASFARSVSKRLFGAIIEAMRVLKAEKRDPAARLEEGAGDEHGFRSVDLSRPVYRS
ncbi:hypothetical protein F4778DRAFT_739241 [Xylariomycetidae sp. FL2044]|nr:hypothetical protein F4778DRAFT_739241 [Xylariomycetidae sp. FL2044]